MRRNNMDNEYINKEIAEVVRRGQYNSLKIKHMKLLQALADLVARDQSDNRTELALIISRFGATDLLTNTCMSAVSYLRSHGSDT